MKNTPKPGDLLKKFESLKDFDTFYFGPNEAFLSLPCDPVLILEISKSNLIYSYPCDISFHHGGSVRPLVLKVWTEEEFVIEFMGEAALEPYMKNRWKEPPVFVLYVLTPKYYGYMVQNA